LNNNIKEVKAWRIPRSHLENEEPEECCTIEHLMCLQALFCNRLDFVSAPDGDGLLFYAENIGLEIGLEKFISQWGPDVKSILIQLPCNT